MYSVVFWILKNVERFTILRVILAQGPILVYVLPKQVHSVRGKNVERFKILRVILAQGPISVYVLPKQVQYVPANRPGTHHGKTVCLAPQSQSEIATNKGISPRRGGVLGLVFN